MLVILWIVLGILSIHAGIKLIGVAFSYIDYGTDQLRKKCPKKRTVYLPPEETDED